jgi:uncharacterized protein
MPPSKSGSDHRTAKHQSPQRSCIICRQVKNKRALIRLVNNDDGVVIDSRGKMPGRGAYLCDSVECWDAALKKNRLDQVLRTKLSEEVRVQLIEYRKNMSTQGKIEE